MGITDPTKPGVWWRGDHCWKEYSPEHTKLIKQAMAAQETTVSLGVIKSTFHPRGHSYVVDLQTMTQSNVYSGNQRSIKIVERQMDPQVYYKDETGRMRPYSGEIAREIILGAAAGVKRLSFMKAPKKTVFVNLQKMKETVHSGGTVAPQVKIQLPWKRRALDNAKMDDKKTLQKELIGALLDGLMDPHVLDKAMEEKFNLLKVSANPYMQSKANGPRQKFIDALCKAAASDNKIIGEILDTLKEKNIERLQSMNIVFHGTPSYNIERILKLGLDPKRSHYPVFYVALNPETSKRYAADRKVVVLLELKAPSVQEAWKDVHTIPIQQPELLLPIATAEVW